MTEYFIGDEAEKGLSQDRAEEPKAEITGKDSRTPD